ncbi:MAG: hypothetical protein QM775_13780 [Pirellulales bacterium]
MRIAYVGLLLFAFVGCEPPRGARINDVSVPPADDVGYEVMHVDRKPAQRAFSSTQKVEAVVLVSAGERRLSVRNRSNGHTEEFSATVVAGKEYRLAIGGDHKMTLVPIDQ